MGAMLVINVGAAMHEGGDIWRFMSNFEDVECHVRFHSPRAQIQQPVEVQSG